MTAPAPVRLADLARVTGKTAPDDYVWHFVLHRAGARKERGERLGTLALAPADVAGVGRAELARTGVVSNDPDTLLSVGLVALERALEAERREWVRRTSRAGYADGWGVGLVAERGYRRSLFPSAAVAGLTATPRLIVTPGGSAHDR